MAKKKRQRISYVLPLAPTPGGHRLGVNGLAVDQSNSILYTGGRDGVICAWNLNDSSRSSASDSAVMNGSGPKQSKSATFRSEVVAHTHWVNDLVLAKNGTTLVSASSDVTVKAWQPHGQDSSSATTIGKHSDYVKCLATPGPNADWVASGGLDHKICLWDLNGAGQTLEINVAKAENVSKGSVYALCAKGSVLASGGPESVVRLWDQKSGKSITKLVGHTDNIRDILMSDEGDMLLTASSDQTVKVWSVLAGRCMHTLTMHNESVWCMYSDHPQLSVFYSGDRSGMVAKTDVRHADEFDEGVSVAVCQDHEGVGRIVTNRDHIWTASSSSSVTSWKDVDTEAEIETPPPSPRKERSQSSLSKNTSGDQSQESDESESETNGVSKSNKLPYTSLLRLSVTAPHPARRDAYQRPTHSPPSLRKASEAILDTDPGIIIPIRSQPVEVIEGQNGLIKHVMLNDKKRVLTLDSAGEVVLWDLLKCIPVEAFGKRHLEDVVPQVNTLENINNWCAVDTKTGKLTVMLEDKTCFDAEVYSDDIDIEEKIEFREDQRINLGKWILRNLFTTLLDEEIRRDEVYRRSFRTSGEPAPSIPRKNLSGTISLPVSNLDDYMASPESATTPRAMNGVHPVTPGLPITPGPLSPQLTTATEDGANLSKTQTQTSQPPPASPRPNDYFSAAPNPPAEPAAEATKAPVAPVTPAAEQPGALPNSPTTDDKEEKKKSRFSGKKFQMNFPKTLGRKSADAKQVTSPEEKSEGDHASDISSEKEEKVLEDNFFGVIQRIRQEYSEATEEQPVPVGITPSLPIETPVLRPPPHTMVIIQEDNPESGGLVDLYRGEISQLGNAREVDVLERVAPVWLGELLLKNQIPYKDTPKVSFILHPYPDSGLPSIASPDGNARLNANRMLRTKKILAYVAERIEPPPLPPTDPNYDAEVDGLKPEDYLELYCQERKVGVNITLATLRVHWWKGAGADVVLHYKGNGRKKGMKILGEGIPEVRGEGDGGQQGEGVKVEDAAAAATPAAGTGGGEEKAKEA